AGLAARRGGPAHPGRGRRGDVRQAVLRVVAEQPSTGYQIMAAIASKSQDLWRPGPGSVYPALQAMTDEGLVTCRESEDGKKIYTITEDGTKRLEEASGRAPWERMTRDMAGMLKLRPAMEGLRGAVAQVARSGTEAQRRQVGELLDATRKQIYLILASDDEGDAGDEQGSGEG
ncbi:PadR family transcriptional regulator, partial [uncultured Propionibacterium sp.]|uniref:PadR family transcriptional regulator n=1 Tax=uncultured Propionibacterium sp. TaxID=218066 RepID=UPI00292CBEDE